LKHLLCLLLASSSTAFGASISGTFDFSFDFSTQSQAISFSAIAPSQTSSTGTGSPIGPDFINNLLTAIATDYVPGVGTSVNLAMDLVAGPGTSFTNAFAQAISGATRITNSGATAADFNIEVLGLQYRLQTSGLDTTSLQLIFRLEAFNPQTSTWNQFGGDTQSIGNNGLYEICFPVACSVTVPFFSSMPAGISLDVRANILLSASASQGQSAAAAVPEPSSLLLTSSAAAAAAFLRRRRRRSGKAG
jgi:hypothetical protein